MLSSRNFFLAINFAVLAASASAADRVPWTTSRVHGSPEPPHPYVVANVFPQIQFEAPICAEAIPGANRIVVVQQYGKFVSVPCDPAAAHADLFGNLKEFDHETVETYGIAFHPRFAENRLAYVWLNLDTKGQPTRENGTHIVRFQVTTDDPPRLDLKTGAVIFTWRTGGHNGGNLRFGPDGMLYISTGDAGSPDPPDPFATGQDISDVLASVVRIDVDHADSGKAYAIPKDNPFVSTPGARGEVWAYGFRNPWRLSFDQKTGDLWVGDVGWELWEMIHRVQRGGNYGWSITEGGRQDVRPDRLRGPTPILRPVLVHSHEESASITGGEVYYGRKLPELDGAYIYGDWQMGTFWSLRYDGEKVTEHRELCRTGLMPAGFGVTPDGELLLCDHGGGGIWRLERNAEADSPSAFPRRLSETGLFTDVARQTPAPGVAPYTVNAARWADGAESDRWIALPGESTISVADKELGVMPRGRWVFPKETVFAKTYSIELEQGKPETHRRLETQLLHFDGRQWAAYSYRWNDKQTDAELVGPRGDEASLPIKDSAAPDGARLLKWRYFSRAECLRCHNMWDNFAPGFVPAQLDCPQTGSGGSQLAALKTLGLVPQDDHPHDGGHMADPKGGEGELETRARSYLHANCSVCHREGGGGSVPTWLTIDTPLDEARLVGRKPVQGDLGLDDGRVIAPGAPTSSVLLYRMATAGRGHMPYLGGKTVDDRGVLLVRDWIAGLSPEKDTPEPIKQQRATEAAAVDRAAAGDSGAISAMLTTRSGALRLALAVMDGTLKDSARELAIAQGAAQPDALQRDLFERFAPEAQRRKTLGPDLQAEKLLALEGNAARGQAQFAAVCAACHRAGVTGVDFAPDLSHIATKYDHAKIVDRILQPGKFLEPQWQLATVVTKSGETLAGFIGSRTDDAVTLRLAGGAGRKLPTGEIASLTTARVAVMPEGILQNFTETEAADLLAFLWTLK